MSILLMVLLGQFVFAVIVIFVLKSLLDKELMMAAIEHFESCKSSPELKEITIRTASNVSDEFKSQLESVKQRKFVQSNLIFQEDASLKGGVIITVGDIQLDFSLLSRLKHF